MNELLDPGCPIQVHELVRQLRHRGGARPPVAAACVGEAEAARRSVCWFPPGALAVPDCPCRWQTRLTWRVRSQPREAAHEHARHVSDVASVSVSRSESGATMTLVHTITITAQAATPAPTAATTRSRALVHDQKTIPPGLIASTPHPAAPRSPARS